MAALTPRADRVIDLLGLDRARRFVDVGCGTAAYAHLLARRAGLDGPPVCLDLAPGPGPVDTLAWPEHLPLAGGSVDALSCFYYIRRFDDDVVHGFGGEIARVLAPGGRALIVEMAPVVNEQLNRLHRRMVGAGCAEVDLRGWGRAAALFTECGFAAVERVDVGPYIVPPIPRLAIRLQQAGL
jgi:SAM-dependent methyltransferase